MLLSYDQSNLNGSLNGLMRNVESCNSTSSTCDDCIVVHLSRHSKLVGIIERYYAANVLHGLYSWSKCVYVNLGSFINFLNRLNHHLQYQLKTCTHIIAHCLKGHVTKLACYH